MKKLTTLILCILTPFLMTAQQISESVYFNSAQHLLTEEATTDLNAFFEKLTKHQASYTILLVGHTDTDGDLTYNQNLSEQRCKSVKDYLLSQGFKAQQVSFEGKGFSAPIAANNDEKGKAQNRRVEIILSTQGHIPSFHAQVPKARVKFNAEEGLDFVYERSGTRITIPANALVDKDGRSVKGEVDLSYREFRDFADFIASDIPMTHRGGQFHSGGMFEMNAQQKGENVFIRQGEYMDVEFELTADSISDLSFYKYDGVDWSTMGALDRTSQQNNFDVTYKPCKKRFFPKSPPVTDSVQNFLDAMKVGYMLSRDNPVQYKEVGFLTADERWADHRYAGKKNYLNYKLKKIKLDEISKDKALYNISFEVVGEDDYKIVDPMMKEVRYAQAVLMKIKDYGKSNRELVPLINRTWIVLSRGKHRPSARRDITKITLKNWADIRVSYDGNTTFKFIVKGYNGFDTLKAQPQLMGNERKKQHKAIAQQLFDEYTEVLDKENKLFASNQKFLKDNWGYFMAYSGSLMHSTEKCMTPYSWIKRFYTKSGVMRNRYEPFVAMNPSTVSMSTLSTLARRAAVGTPLPRPTSDVYKPNTALSQKLEINNFGIFNCDAIRKLQDPQEIIAYFIDENDEPIDARVVNVIDYNINGILKMYAPTKVPFSTVSPTALLVIDYFGENYFLDTKDFAELDLEGKSAYTFKLKNISKLVPDVEGLRNTVASK
ncbi:MAG: OmpA family protein [Aureispira sp.]|nr:OmpA family protein [Aureispira sp.]